MAEQDLSLQFPGSQCTALDASSKDMVWEVHFHGRQQTASVLCHGLHLPP